MEFPLTFKPLWRRIEVMNLTYTAHRWKAEILRISKHSLLLKIGPFLGMFMHLESWFSQPKKILKFFREIFFHFFFI